MKPLREHILHAEATWTNSKLSIIDVRNEMARQLMNELSYMILHNSDLSVVESGEFSKTMRVKLVVMKEDDFHGYIEERASEINRMQDFADPRGIDIITNRKTQQ